MESPDLNKKRLSLGYKSVLNTKNGTSSLPKQTTSSAPKPSGEPTVNWETAEYVNACTKAGCEPVLDFVVALTDGSVKRCVVTTRKGNLTEKQLTCIVHSLRTNKTIQEIDFSSHGITKEGAHEISVALQDNRCLEVLILGNNEIGSEGLIYIAEVLKENNVIKELDVRDNDIGNHGAAKMADALTQNDSISKVDLQKNSIKAQGAIALASSFKVNNTLKVMNLRFNEVGDNGATAIGTALKLNNSIQELDLGGNMIGKDGGMALAEGLLENKSLQKLNLRSNSVGDEGAISFAATLKKNKFLIELYLGSNQINVEGCVAIAESLKYNNTLQKLDLQGINMGAAGALAIADALRVNTALCELILELDKIPKEDAAIIAAAIKTNTTLTDLHMGNPEKLEPDTRYAILSTLRLNKFVKSLLEKTGFRDHYQKNAQKIRGAIQSRIQSNNNVDVAQLIAYISERLKSIEDQLGSDREIDPQELVRMILPDINIDLGSIPTAASSVRPASSGGVPNGTSRRVNLNASFEKDQRPPSSFSKRPSSRGAPDRADNFDATTPSRTSKSPGMKGNFSEDELMNLVTELVYEGVNTKSEDMKRELDEKLEEYDKELKSAANRLTLNIQQLGNDLARRLDTRIEDKVKQLSRDLAAKEDQITEQARIQAEKLKMDNRAAIQQVKDDMEHLFDTTKKVSSGLSQLKQTDLDSAVKAQVANQMEPKLQQERKEIDLQIENLRAEYLKKLMELQQRTVQDNQNLRQDLMETIDKTQKQQATYQVQPLASRMEELALEVEQQHNIMHRVDVSEENLKRLEELVLIQQQEQSQQIRILNEQLRHMQESHHRGIDSVTRDWQDKVTQLESKLRGEEKARLAAETKATAMQDRLNNLEKQLKQLQEVQSKSPVKMERNLKRVEEELQHKHQDTNKAFQAELERVQKKLSEVLYRMSIVEDALKSEQETSLQALQALLSD